MTAVAAVAIAGFLYARSGPSAPEPAAAAAPAAGAAAPAPEHQMAHMLEPAVDPPESAAKGRTRRTKLPPLDVPSVLAAAPARRDRARRTGSPPSTPRC